MKPRSRWYRFIPAEDCGLEPPHPTFARRLAGRARFRDSLDIPSSHLRVMRRFRGLQSARRWFSAGATTNPSGFRLSPEVLRHLACPITKEPLRYDPEAQELISDTIRVAYPIRHGLPHLIPTDARRLPEASEVREASEAPPRAR